MADSGEPPVIFYNVRASQSVYIFWLVMMGDVGVLGLLSGITLGILDSYRLFFAVVLAVPIYMLLLRARRPRGYDMHLFATLATRSRYLRPGRSERRQVVEPDPVLHYEKEI